jgi:hypothetical protein
MNAEQELDVEDPVVGDNNGVEIESVAESQNVVSDKELNFRALREKADAAERRAEENERKVRQYEQALMDIQQAKEDATPDEDEVIDFSDAVDAEAFAKITKRFERQEQKIKAKLDALEGKTRQQALASRDPSYVDVINNYLPGVLKDNPTIKDIIKKAPQSQQYDLMYQFATSNKDYVIEKHIESAKSEGRIIEEESPKINTMGAMKGGSKAVGKESALSMDHDTFYGENGYLSRILDGKIR